MLDTNRLRNLVIAGIFVTLGIILRERKVQNSWVEMKS